MTISESELEELLLEDFRDNDGQLLSSRGFETALSMMAQEGSTSPRFISQFNLGPYGIADIVGYTRLGQKIIVELFELKIVPLTVADFDQICRYRKAILRYFERFDIRMRMYLVGPSLSTGHYIHNCIDNLTVVTFNYNLDGIIFESHSGGWFKTDDSFDYRKSLRNAQAVH